MNIYDPYPESVELDDKTYQLDLAFDVVLLALDVAEDERLTRAQRIATQCAVLLRDDKECPEDTETQQRLLQLIYALFPEGDHSAERSIDFHQDAGKIRSGFFRIGIDLTKERIHFFRFLELLSDLPDDTALMRTISIRTRPLPKPNKHNSEQIAELQKAKAKVAIKYGDGERQRRFFESLKNSTLLTGGER